MIDAVIITFNEALNLPVCLEALAGWTRRVFVVDSGSTDGTPQIAAQLGAAVTHHDWEGYARQKNWALSNLPLEADWVLVLDADEIITDALRQRIAAIVARPVQQVPENGFFINRQTRFLGRPIRHCGYFPSWNMRLFKRGRALYEDRPVHEHMVIDEPVGYIAEPMLHDDRRGLEHYLAKHNRYSTLEAVALFQELGAPATAAPPNLPWSTRLRRWLKRNLMHRLPAPGAMRFLYMYLLRRGFLDGRAGLEFSRVISMYDSMVAIKLRDLRRRWRQSDQEGLVYTSPSRALAVQEGTLLGPLAPAMLGLGAVAPAPSPPGRGWPSPGDGRVRVAPDTAGAPVGAVTAGRSEGALPASPMGEKPLGPLPAPSPVSATPIHPLPEGEGATPAAPVPRDPRADALAADPRLHSLPPGDWPALASAPVSVLVPVKNEQSNIVECLRRVLWANEIVVVDSQSTDDTVPLAQAMGAQVHQFHYSPEGWPKKKNWALEQVPWRNPWVLILDADEHMTAELAAEVVQVVTGRHRPGSAKRAGCGDGYWLNRRFMFMGRWIKHCGYYPSYNVRLFKHRVGRYERIGTLGDTTSGDNEVHEHVILSTGEAGYLGHDFLHYAYPDLMTWIEKHNRYSNWEAHAMAAGNRGLLAANPFGGPMERRRWVKQTARRLPLRPTLRFVYTYLLRGGFRDGYPGYVMSRLMAWYEFTSIAKFREMRRRGERGA